MFYFDFPVGWYALLAFGLLIGIISSYVRKSYKGAVRFGIIGLIICVVIEMIGVGLGLWNYIGGNWPVILWVTYFVFAVSWYQLMKALEKLKIFKF